jgi:hypothetical protein
MVVGLLSPMKNFARKISMMVINNTMTDREFNREQASFWQRRYAARLGRLYVQLAANNVFSKLFGSDDDRLNCSAS